MRASCSTVTASTCFTTAIVAARPGSATPRSTSGKGRHVMNSATKLQSRASSGQNEARQTLLNLFDRCPIPQLGLLVNLGLYMRSSVLAKTLYVNELYQKIVNIPGAIMEFGVWWGTNLALFESLRAIYEPYNHARKVVGFDTF